MDDFDNRIPRTFLEELINNLSKEERSYRKTQTYLKRIRKNVRKKKDDEFYINLYIDKSDNAYLASKSLPYQFNSAIDRVDSLMKM